MVKENNMKRRFLGLKTGLLIGLSTFVLSAMAAEALFYTSFVKDKDGEGRSLIIRSNTSHRYSNLGVSIDHPDFNLLTNNKTCIMNPKNNWCLFPGGYGEPRTFKLARLSNRTVEKENINIRVALNAKNQPISVQKFKLLTITPGRIIGYMYGWEKPPLASEIADAYYTHVLIAFGLFSTSSPGEINIEALSGFGGDQPDLKTYVKSLQDKGIKVLLSLGGASTNIPDTTVSFDQAVSLAATPQAFIDKFTASMTFLVDTYGFDGFDFDIEQGLNEALSFTDPTEGCTDGTVYNSKCDIAYLSSVINTFHASSPTQLLTLAPQVPNIAATPSFTAIWGNYAALVMQTAASLEWVGFQTYNSGCAYGIDRECYPLEGTSLTSSPDSAVAFATDLLEDWPDSTPSGVPTGFQKYKSLLKPSQVVLGYTVMNGSGASDGSPSAVINVVKDAIQCLRTGDACDNYKPPNTYPDIGGVFDWTLNFDKSNNYAFSRGLQACVLGGDCSNVSMKSK